MGITFDYDLERDLPDGSTRTIALTVEGDFAPPTPARLYGHPDRQHDGDPGEASITRATLTGTAGGCILRTLTDAEVSELELALVEAAEEEALAADEARAEYYADDYGDDDYGCWDEVPA